MSDFFCSSLLSLAHPPPPDDEWTAYLIEIRGLDGGDSFLPGESIKNVRVYVKEFVVRKEFSGDKTKETVLSSDRVREGELDVKVVCDDQTLFDKTIDIDSGGSEIPSIEIKEDADGRNCTLTVNYNGDRKKHESVSFSIYNPDKGKRHCLDNTDSYIVGRGHEACFNDKLNLNDKCQGVLLMSYRSDPDIQQLVSGDSLDDPDNYDLNSRIVIIADSIPNGCQLTVDDKDYPIKMPSSLPNLTSKVTKVGYNDYNELDVESEEGTTFFVSSHSGVWHRYQKNKSIYSELTEENRLMVFEHDETKNEVRWSYLAGPRLVDADGRIMIPKIGESFAVDNKYLVKEVADCQIISYDASDTNDKSIVSFNNNKLPAGHLLSVTGGDSCQKIQVGKFEVPFIQQQPDRVATIGVDRYDDNAGVLYINAQLLTKNEFSRLARVNERDVADKVFVYTKFSNQNWQLVSGNGGSDWGSNLQYNINRPSDLENDHPCMNNDDIEGCKRFLYRSHSFLVRVIIGNKNYWY